MLISDLAVAHLTSGGAYLGSVIAGSGVSGLALDARGKVWATNCLGNTASRIDPALGPLGSDGTTAVGQADFTTADLGGSPFDYSNMTGTLRASAAGNGTWTATFNSENPASKWGQVQWAAREHKRFSLSSEIVFLHNSVIMRSTMRSRRKPLRSGAAHPIKFGPEIRNPAFLVGDADGYVVGSSFGTSRAGARMRLIWVPTAAGARSTTLVDDFSATSPRASTRLIAFDVDGDRRTLWLLELPRRIWHRVSFVADVLDFAPAGAELAVLLGSGELLIARPEAFDGSQVMEQPPPSRDFE